MKEIPLTKGQVALVNDGDFAWLSQWTWRAHKAKNSFYAYRCGKPCLIYMHRELLGLTPGDGKEGDHRDGNGLNNQRGNLRICTVLENSWNKHRRFLGKHGAWGVEPRNGRWRARIRYKLKCLSLGTFDTKEEAIAAYNKAATKLRGEFAVLNKTG
jgi:hypothetical protein